MSQSSLTKILCQFVCEWKTSFDRRFVPCPHILVGRGKGEFPLSYKNHLTVDHCLRVPGFSCDSSVPFIAVMSIRSPCLLVLTLFLIHPFYSPSAICLHCEAWLVTLTRTHPVRFYAVLSINFFASPLLIWFFYLLSLKYSLSRFHTRPLLEESVFVMERMQSIICCHFDRNLHIYASRSMIQLCFDIS